MKNELVLLVTLAVSALCAASLAAAPKGSLALVQDGVSRAPIVIFKDAPPITRRAADELAQYIKKVSGAKPKVIEGRPDPLPERAIWVGYQPVLKKVFPKIDFDFKHPEEILIAANKNHLVIAGRDRWDPNRLVVKGKRNTVNGIQEEYGTCNAVYTFIQDFLDVRWLWPGELGLDVIKRKTIAFAPFQHRYHPTMRSRSGLFTFSVLLRHSSYGQSGDWARQQRFQLDSLYVHPGHAFKTWWDRFHKTHPEYFALQPDGTRGGGKKPYPSAKTVKICHSNPGVWKQWLADVEEQINANPGLTCFNASPNDSYGVGNCVCAKCRAWDHPDADLRPFFWQGKAQRCVALSDRDVAFANQCARLLKERFPDRDYYVSMNAYGNSRPVPLKTVPADNVIVSNVANMFWSLDTKDKDCNEGKTYSRHYADWGKVTKNQIWRPNTGNPAGWQNGLPDIPLERIMKSFRFAIDNQCIGIYVDTVPEHWATMGPLYYALAHMAWNPSKDWRAVMDDYYRRGFGPAAAEIKAYWVHLEASRNRKVDDYPGETNGYAEVYNKAFFDKAYGLLDQAAKKAANSPEKYGKRIAFVRVGLDHVRLFTELRQLSLQMLKKGSKDRKAADLVRAKWDEAKRNSERIPYAIYWPIIRPGKRMERGGLFHPDRMKLVRRKYMAPWLSIAKGGGPRRSARFESAEKAGWELAFQDNFDRAKLGDNWKPVDGKWTVRNGALHGSGILVSARGFPGKGAVGYQRMEFEAVTDVKEKDGTPGTRISDISSLLHVKLAGAKPDPLSSGYFFQFGGRWNKQHQITRGGQLLVSDVSPKIRITPGKPQKFVVECSDGRVNLFVNGKSVLAHRESASIVGNGHDRVGFFFYTPVKVLNVKVYVKRLDGGME
jgi:Domain of unknown function (DUF4838)